MWLLDTNVAIDLRDGRISTVARLANLRRAPKLSVFTRIELEGGVYREARLAQPRRRRLEAMLAKIETLPFEDRVIDAYGRIVAATSFSRRKVIDRLIAATAIVHDLTLITTNADDFADIPGLKLEVWPVQ